LPAPLLGRDLTIKADAGVMPTLRLSRDSLVGGKAPAALLDLVGGRVTLEGLEFLLDSGDRDAALAAIRTENTELTVRRCRFHGQAPRVWVDDSVIAPSRDAEATLIAASDPDGLDWRGRGNLYGRIGTYLLPVGVPGGHKAIREFARWAETASLIRESGTTA